MDAFTTEGIDWHALEDAVEADYSAYFAITRASWRSPARTGPRSWTSARPAIRRARRGALLEAEARRLSRERPDRPMIVAGSTGSIPATAELIAAIARLPRGAVVLPGLDMDLDEASWETIGGTSGDDADPVHGHPQASLRRLLDRHLRIARSDVAVLGTAPEAAAARGRLLSEALRPADTTDRWSQIDPRERLAMSRSGSRALPSWRPRTSAKRRLRWPSRCARPSRNPAGPRPSSPRTGGWRRRVAAELARWDLSVDDSAGMPLAETSAGRLARLAAEAAADDLRPVRVLALLAHPLVRLGFARRDRGACRRRSRDRDLARPGAGAGPRGPAGRPGPAPHRSGLSHPASGGPPDGGRLDPGRRDPGAAAGRLRRLHARFTGRGSHRPRLPRGAHRRTFEALAARPGRRGCRAGRGPGGAQCPVRRPRHLRDP